MTTPKPDPRWPTADIMRWYELEARRRVLQEAVNRPIPHAVFSWRLVIIGVIMLTVGLIGFVGVFVKIAKANPCA